MQMEEDRFRKIYSRAFVDGFLTYDAVGEDTEILHFLAEVEDCAMRGVKFGACEDGD